MIQYGRLLSFPFAFRNLEQKLNDVKLQKLTARREGDNQIIVEATANNHNVNIVIFDKEIQVSSHVMLFCDCEFFAYNLAFSLHQHSSLLNPQNFVLVPPKKKNVSLVLSGCKHIVKVAKELYARKNDIII